MSRTVKTKRKVIVACIIICAFIFGGLSWKYINTRYQGEPVWLYIPQNASDDTILDSLKTNLGDNIGNRVYTIWAAVSDDHSKIHGAYQINPNTTVKDIARRLVGCSQTPISFTFNNIRTLDQLAERVDDRFEMSASDFIHACDSLLADAGFMRQEYTAAFIPNTYEFYWTITPCSIVTKLLEYRNSFWSDERRAKAKDIGLSPVNVATLASIVEEETNNKEERAIVARLYLNRLDKGMRLQADPTVKWAVGDFSLRRITGKYLSIDSPYNTYRYKGLPPGPIRIPEQTTLDAVLNAPRHNYIYMCAKDDFSGTHNFSADFSTHQQNASRYRSALNNRNIK